MKAKVLFVALFALTLGVSCTGNHIIGNADERAAVQQDFELRQAELPDGDLFSIFDKPLSQKEREALTFLYAYMPLSDIADNSGEYFLENVDCTFRAQEEMPWGKSIPEREFRHFVLPIRVNNENLDNSRMEFYEELKDRVKDLSMYDAVQEVNHWCHEKVIYAPTDMRTSSPLATVKTAYGRCGEESTFTVAALRAVGIPARQVYTPLWAHTDSNHAWVEAWVDGEWFFFGACEPQPVLNLGWFNAPASRAMLMHTRVFGAYNGPEDAMYRTPRNTEINITSNYATVAHVDLIVTETDGSPVSDATVEFKVFNFGSFGSIATLKTDNEGKTSLTSGKGDLLVWASKDGKYGYAKVSVGIDEELTVVLDHVVGEKTYSQTGRNFGIRHTAKLDIVPPPEKANLPEVTPEQTAENERRMAVEDSIRNAYTSTFMTDEMAREFAAAHELSPDVVGKMLVDSRGNHEVICEFLSGLQTAQEKEAGVDLLRQISVKDLKDVTIDVLKDHLLNSRSCANVEYFSRYVRNPRVSNETLTPYKQFFLNEISQEDQEAYRSDPMKLVSWVAENIRVDNDCNLNSCPISPAGVWKARVADSQSRNIFFVSLCRALGIPARIDMMTRKLQVLGDDGVTDVNFEAPLLANAATGKIKINYKSADNRPDPRHFSISKVTPEGSLMTLNFLGMGMMMGQNMGSFFNNGISVDEGDYVLETGTRLANGSVLSSLTFFTVEPQKTTTLDVVLRESEDEVQVIGSFDSESKFKLPDSDEMTSVLATTGRGYFIVAVLGVGQEPTNHALGDISAKKKEFEEWDRKIILLFPSEEQYKNFNPKEFPSLPSTVTYGIDVDGAIQNQIATEMHSSNKSSLPMVIIGDTFDRVVFFSQGYTIGTGEQLMNVIKKL